MAAICLGLNVLNYGSALHRGLIELKGVCIPVYSKGYSKGRLAGLVGLWETIYHVFITSFHFEIATTCLFPCKVVYMSLKPLSLIADELTDFIYLLLSSKEEIEKEQGEDSTTLLKKEHYLAILTDLFFGRSIRHATTVFFFIWMSFSVST